MAVVTRSFLAWMKKEWPLVYAEYVKQPEAVAATQQRQDYKDSHFARKRPHQDGRFP